VVKQLLSTRPVRGQFAAEVTLFESESVFVTETSIETPFPLWMEVAFRDTVRSRFASLGVLRLKPAAPVVDADVVTVVVLMVVLVDVLTIVLVTELVIVLVVVVVRVACVCGLAGIVTVEVVVLVWVASERKVTVSEPRPPPPVR
jgi:hypothetical protein